MKKPIAGSIERRKLSELENEEGDEMSEEESSESDAVDERIEEEEEDGSVFLVGDFVWGKIKNHPWWPGQIYDESTASDLALKHKPKDKDSYLVAYFGDKTFSWCLLSQLKSFDVNFQSFSRQRGSKSFRLAVEDALHILRDLVGREMGCDLVEKHRQVAENAGIRKEVFVPMVEVDRLAAARFESAAVIARVKNAARLVSMENKLELVMLSSKLLAFYRWKGYIGLPKYYLPVCIEGLEDIGKRGVDIDTLSSQDGLVSNEDQRCKRRKRKSVTDTMKKEIDTVVKSVEDCKKTPPSRRKLVGQTDLSLSDKGKAKGNKSAAGILVVKDGANKSRNVKRKKESDTPVASIKQVGFEPVVLSLQTDTRVGERISKAAKLIVESPPIKKQCNIVFEKDPTEECNIKNEEQLLTTDRGHEDIDRTREEMVSVLKPASFIPLHERPFGSKLDVFSLNKLSLGYTPMNEDNDEDDKDEGTPLSAIIFMTFSPGVPLPSKTDLLTEYSKFGSLNEEDTSVLPTSLCAQVYFIKKSEGERAFNHTVKTNSTNSGTQYRIRYIPRGSNFRNVLLKTSLQSTKLNNGNLQPLSIKYLKEKLETLISKLINVEGETISNDLKNELHCEMSNLLTKLT